MPRPLRPLEQVRADWRERFGPPPSLRSAELLDLMLAWRVQAAEEGGLGDATRKALLGAKPMVADGLEEGTRIIREWKGIRHQVDALESGFLYEGRTYVSLSMIAREITGCRRNGPKFFGLRVDPARTGSRS